MSDRARGLACMVAASFFVASMCTCVSAVLRWEPHASALVATLARFAVNLAVLIGLGLARGDLRMLLGDGGLALWLRGAFGAAGVMLGFASLAWIPISEASFLHATNGVFVAALSPLFLKQRPPPLAWL